MAEIKFAPGLTPVLKHGRHNQKDHAGKGRARSDDEIAGLAQQRAGIGKVLDKSVVGEDGVGYLYRGERHSLDEVNPTGAARIITEQGWDAPAQSVDQATFDRLAQRDDLVTVYRGGPVGLEKGMVDGTPFIGDGKSGPGTYVTTDRERAERFADRWVKTGEDENGRAVHDIYQGNVVPMLMPKSMYDNPGNGEMNRANNPLTNEGLNGVGAVTGFIGGDRVVWNTGAMIVGPPVPSAGDRQYAGRWNLDDVAKALNEPPTDGEVAFYKIENGRVTLLYAEDGARTFMKHLGGKHDQKTHAGGGGGSTKTGKIVGDEVHVGDLQTYLPGSEGEWQEDLNAVSEAFVQWGVNYDTRVASATIMGLESGFSPRGVGDDPSPFDQNLESILRNPNKTNIELAPVFVQQGAQAVFKDTTLLMDASTTPLPAGTKLHRGARLLSDDPRLSATVGDEFEMPLSAFATQPTLPNDFARGRSLAPGDQRSQGLRTGVIFTVESGARGHVTQSLGDGVGSEVLAQGRFRVKDRKVNEGMVEITLEQVSYYDVRTGDWSDA